MERQSLWQQTGKQWKVRRRLWAEAGREHLGAGAGHGQLLRVDSGELKATEVLHYHHYCYSPFQAAETVLVRINMLKWYSKNQAWRS